MRCLGFRAYEMGFLEKYGYLDQEEHAHNAAEVKSAVREFQWLSHLPVTGKLDSATLWLMSRPRCGVGDGESHSAWAQRVRGIFSGMGGQRARRHRSKRYSQQGEKWSKRQLTYRLVNWPRHLSPGQVRLAVRAAFQLWSNASALAFRELTHGPADIRLAFYEGEHNDGTGNAFDGPGGALAHAFFPCRGEAHFDMAERWTLNGHKGHNLFVVTAHEIGHTLGLEHSPVRNALMSPYYKKLGRAFVLSWDDIAAVQRLYGKPPSGLAVQLPGQVYSSFLQDWESTEGTQGPGPALPPYCQTFFDAITMDQNRTVYVFRGARFWTVSAQGRASAALPLQRRWPQLPASVEAAAVSPPEGKFYFFRGGRFWRFSGSRLDPGFPRRSSAAGLPRHPDYAFYYPPLGNMVLVKGPRYFVLNLRSLTPEPYYPRGLADWKGLPQGANGAVGRPDGLYFFKDELFWRFDPGRVRVVSRGRWAPELEWTGCQRAHGTDANSVH
ncbi:matrix metalloproteinase-28 isoform X2 [Lepisosteus oculatus]|uniref:matrix metalloproteinase-28 isoform X2 n=1 Tax=Lepisosteus oculatus TaxID=7918 RepID=UPI0037213F5A